MEYPGRKNERTVPAPGSPVPGAGAGVETLPGAGPDLRRFLALNQEILTLVERESQALREPEGAPGFDLFKAKKDLLPQLDELLNKMKQHRVAWQRLSLAERAQHPEIATLLQRNQDLIMKIIVLDRDNEQALLRKGLVPARSLPPANRQRPHFVAELYRRQGY